MLSQEGVRVRVDLDDGILIHCSNCSRWLLPLSSVQDYAQLPHDALLLRAMNYGRLRMGKESKVGTEWPVEGVKYLSVSCNGCGFEVGSYYCSANIHAKWLLRRYAIHLEKVELSLSRDAHSIKHRLQKQLRKAAQQHDQPQIDESRNEAMREEEAELEELLLKASQMGMGTQKHKELLSILKAMAFYDRTVERVHRKAQQTSKTSGLLKQQLSPHIPYIHSRVSNSSSWTSKRPL